ncbi:MAG: hypothetical protein IH840_08390 [Candidatus Heimdallarchaeota archaeon]|nr:hypothetical protein [Candidatus Heimdallarchaeota archaeon]
MFKDLDISKVSVLIAGAGSIGSVVGLLLKEKGYNVALYRRNPPFGVQPVSILGVVTKSIEIEILNKDTLAESSFKSAEIIILTSQKQQIRSILGDLGIGFDFSADQLLISLQNGLDPASEICEILKRELNKPVPRIISGVVWWSATALSTSEVYYHQSGITHLGIPEVSDCPKPPISALKEAVDLLKLINEIQTTENIETIIRQKLLLNTISPILALVKQPYPEALNNLATREVAHLAFDNALTIGKKLGWDLNNEILHRYHILLNSDTMLPTTAKHKDQPIHRASTQISAEKHGGKSSNAHELLKLFISKNSQLAEIILELIEELPPNYQATDPYELLQKIKGDPNFKMPICTLTSGQM